MGGARRRVSRAVLLDTHAFLWFAVAPNAMSRAAYEAVTDAPGAFVSAATVWEVRTRHRLGKPPNDAALDAFGVTRVW